MNSNSLEGHKVLKLTVQLPSSDDIIAALNRIIKAFESPIEIEVVKTRWEEIKELGLSHHLVELV